MLNAVTLMEEQLLSHIKRVAVKSIHVKVHRWHFANIKPNEGETITRFVGHFKSQASLCNFSTKCYSGCERTTSYSEQMISQQLTMGLTNPDNQARMLNEASQLETLQLKIDRLISFETTGDAATTIVNAGYTRSGAVRSSQYKRSQNEKYKNDNRY